MAKISKDTIKVVVEGGEFAYLEKGDIIELKTVLGPARKEVGEINLGVANLIDPTSGRELRQTIKTGDSVISVNPE
jgi:hypothetical protein